MRGERERERQCGQSSSIELLKLTRGNVGSADKGRPAWVGKFRDDNNCLCDARELHVSARWQV